MIRMTPNRRLMLEGLQRRNYAPNTIETCLKALEQFSRRFRKAPDRLGAEEIRQYNEINLIKRLIAWISV